jgi:hypothetical protein
MSSVMAMALNSEQEMSQNALVSKHTHAPELRASSRGTRTAVLASRADLQEKEVGIFPKMD